MSENLFVNNEISDYYRQLQKSFENIFVKQNSKKNILEIIDAIKKNKPVLNIAENERGSFPTIFEPFHSGNPVFQKLKNKLDENLISFCELAGKIESLTDTFVIYNNEPFDQEKTKILSLLEQFIKILPSFETFKKWLK